MPPQPENVVAEGKGPGPSPIIDDPKTVEEIYKGAGLEPPEKEHEPEERTQPWEKPLAEFAEAQKELQSRIAELAEAVSQGFSRPAPERIVEREVERRPEPTPPSWRKGLKDDQVALLQEAIRDEAGALMRNYEQGQLAPALSYILKTQDALLESHLASKYPDEDFGFGALNGEAKAYRQALGNNIDLETAYRHIAFEKTNQALMKVREQTLAAAKKTKDEHPMDDTTVGRTAADEETTLDADELRAAQTFFGGADPRTGKPRTRNEVRALWLAHKTGAERDKNPFFDVDAEPEFKRRG